MADTLKIESKTHKEAMCVAFWSLAIAEKESNGFERYAKISALVFTAFMLEGALINIGRVLLDWDGRKENIRSKDRHKKIRRILGLPNGDTKVQKKEAEIQFLLAFRDAFAHPKYLREEFEVENADIAILQKTEPGLYKELEKISDSKLEELVDYVSQLEMAASNKIAKDYINYRDCFFIHMYPHLDNDSELKSILTECRQAERKYKCGESDLQVDIYTHYFFTSQEITLNAFR